MQLKIKLVLTNIMFSFDVNPCWVDELKQAMMNFRQTPCYPLFHWFLLYRQNELSFLPRKKSSRRIRLARSILPSLTALMTCHPWPTLMMPVSCGTQLSGTRTSSSTPTLVSSVLPSTPTSVSPSTLSAPWRSTLASAGWFFLYQLWNLFFHCLEFQNDRVLVGILFPGLLF